MLKLFSKFVFLLFAVLVFNFTISAQIDVSSPNGRQNPQKEDYPKNIKETLAKQRIEKQKKEYEELVKRSEEAVKLSEELEQAFTVSNQLSPDDQKKLERLEKLVKKIRDDLGAQNDDDDPDNDNSQPTSLQNAFQVLQSNSVKLFDEIRKSTRYSVSVVAIQSSNLLLKIVKFIRLGK